MPPISHFLKKSRPIKIPHDKYEDDKHSEEFDFSDDFEDSEEGQVGIKNVTQEQIEAFKKYGACDDNHMTPIQNVLCELNKYIFEQV